MLMDNAGNTFLRSNGGTWAAGAALPSDTSFEGLTCLSATSCLALTAGFNTTTVTSYTVYAWNGGTWSAAGSLPSVVVSDGDSVRGFSCAASTACVDLFFDPTTSSNVLYTYDGSAWTASSLPGGFSPQRPVACSPGGNCFAVGSSANGAGFFQYLNGAWSAVPNGTQGTFEGSPNAMSCGSATFCGSVPGDNTLDVFDGTAWALSPVGGTNQVQAVSCATSSFCAGVDSGGDYVTYDGTAWSAPAAVSAQCTGSHPCPQFFGAAAITCPSAGSCAAIDGSGNVWRYAAGAWASGALDQAVVSNPLPQGGISCIATGFCAVASRAQVAVYNGASGTWTATSADIGAHDLDSVACTSAAFCLAVDRSGQYTTWNGGSWSPMASFDTNAAPGSPESVACSSSTLCVAAGGDGNAEVYQGAGWTTPNPLAGGGSLSAASCVRPSGSLPGYCVVSTADAVYYLEVQGGAPTWSVAQAVPANNGDSILALGCATALSAATGVQNYAWAGKP